MAEEQAEPAEGTTVMCFPASALVVGVGGVVLFVGLLVLSNLFPGIDSSGHHLDRQNPLVTAFFAGFALLGVWVILCYFVERHEFDAAGLRYRTLTRRGMLAWRDVARLGYSGNAKWLRLQAADGRVVRLSIMLTGLRPLARTLLAHVAVENIEPEARLLLQNALRGQLPSVWR